MAKIIREGGKSYRIQEGKEPVEIKPKFPTYTAKEVTAMQTPQQQEYRLKRINIEKIRLGQEPITAQRLREVDFPEQAYEEKQKLIKEGEMRAAELVRPVKEELIPKDLPAQKWMEKNIPILGPGAAAFGTALGAAGEMEGRAATGGELFGAAVETLGLSRLPWVGSFIGRMSNTPAASAKSLATQSNKIRTDVRNVMRQSINPSEALVGMENLETELNTLEREIKGNVARSAELRANPEDVDKIERDILMARNLIYLYKRQLYLDPNSLATIQQTLMFAEEGIEE